MIASTRHTFNDVDVFTKKPSNTCRSNFSFPSTSPSAVSKSKAPADCTAPQVRFVNTNMNQAIAAVAKCFECACLCVVCMHKIHTRMHVCRSQHTCSATLRYQNLHTHHRHDSLQGLHSCHVLLSITVFRCLHCLLGSRLRREIQTD